MADVWMYNNPQSDELDFFTLLRVSIFLDPWLRGSNDIFSQKNAAPIFYIYKYVQKTLGIYKNATFDQIGHNSPPPNRVWLSIEQGESRLQKRGP